MTAPGTSETAARAIDRLSWSATGTAAPASARATSAQVGARTIERHAGATLKPNVRRYATCPASRATEPTSRATAAPTTPRSTMRAAATATVTALDAV